MIPVATTLCDVGALVKIVQVSMNPSHKVLSRAMTEVERHAVGMMTKREWASYGCIFMVLGWIPIALICILIACVVGWLDRPPIYALSIIVGGIALTGWIIIAFIRGVKEIETRERHRARKDLESDMVQVLEVNHPRSIEIGALNDNAPILAMDIGDDVILYLQGQWLLDAETYSGECSTDDPDQETFNGLPAPLSYPSSGFTMTRTLNSGRVLSIQVDGVYQPPESLIEALKPEHDFRDSELFTGRLDDIAEILRIAHRSA